VRKKRKEKMSRTSNTVPFVTAATTLVAMEGYSVKATSGLVEKSANSALAIGVVRRGAAAGAVSDIAMPGDVCPVILSGTVYAGSILAIGADSAFSASTPSDGDIIGAIALEAGVSGALVDALIVKATRHEAG
jgi:hypothetical protein